MACTAKANSAISCGVQRRRAAIGDQLQPMLAALDKAVIAGQRQHVAIVRLQASANTACGCRCASGIS